METTIDDLYQLTLTETQMRLVRLALANWDGWDSNLRTTLHTLDGECIDTMRCELAADILAELA